MKRILSFSTTIITLFFIIVSSMPVRGQGGAGLIISVGTLLIMGNTSTTRGSITPTSHYVYPNSNVTPLGYTSSRVKKFSILFPPKFRARDLDNLYNMAMSKYPGSDLILDNKVDTRFTTRLFLFQTMKVTLSGTAAHMEVGKQDIGQDNFVPMDNNSSVPVTQEASSATAATNQRYNQFNTESSPGVVLPQREPFKSPRIGIQYSKNLNMDVVNPGMGINAEFFIGRRVSMAPNINYYLAKRSDLGYGMGTFETKRYGTGIDFHTYFVDKSVGVYLVSGVSFDMIKYSSEGSSYYSSSTNTYLTDSSMIGAGIGLGISTTLASGRLIPFVEGSYWYITDLTDEVAEKYKMGSGLRTSFGIRLSMGKSQ